MRNVKIFLILAMVIFICSCIIKSVGSRANTSTYYNETASHLTTKAETIKELRRIIEINDEESAERFRSSTGPTEIMITSKLITHTDVMPGVGRRSDSCDWCDIRELYLTKAEFDSKVVLYGFYMKCPGMRYNFGIPFSQKETAEIFHALSLKMIELSNCE